MNNSHKPKVVAVLGATATGKTSVGIELARALNGEVINADSRLFYRGMNIATAKPTDDERRDVPHHLIDFLDIDDHFSLAEFLYKARSTVTEVIERGKLPIVVGGSGQYVWALIEGWEVPEVEPDLELRVQLENRIEESGIESLVSELRQIAPDVIDSTDLNNPRRVIRAVERARSGESDGDIGQRKPEDPPFDSYLVGLSVDREVLHQRVTTRLQSMLSNGWVNEVQALVDTGHTDKGRALSGIGYRQMIGHLAGDYNFNEAVRLTTVATNRLIRQQSNWFKRDDDRINWFDMTHEPDRIEELIVGKVKSWHE